jgi:hypothetical protein
VQLPQQGNNLLEPLSELLDRPLGPAQRAHNPLPRRAATPGPPPSTPPEADAQQPRDPARAFVGAVKAAKTADLGRGPRPSGPVATREWDVAHAAALRAHLTQPLAVLATMQALCPRPDEHAAVRTDLNAIFVPLELSRSTNRERHDRGLKAALARGRKGG